MSHQCLDCSFKGKIFPGGVCPACQSANIRNDKASAEEKPKRPYNLIACVLLWGYLAFALANKLSN